MLEIGVLGPVVLHADGTEIPLNSPRQRALIARLATAVDQRVGADALIEDLWRHDPPGDPHHALQAQVSRLRRRLPIPIDRHGDGYMLSADHISVDAVRFDRLVAEGRRLLAAGRPDEACRQLVAALALWRGEAFGTLADVPGLRPVAIRLHEARAAVRGDISDADLAAGRFAEVIAEVEGRIVDNAFDERDWCRLITALHRAGRRGEALSAYQRVRDLFIDQLGVEPGVAIAEAHRAVLADVTPPPGPAPAPARAVTRSGGAPVLPNVVAQRARPGFAGRDDELDELNRAWARASDGVRLVLLSGEPGIGKTRLAAEFAHRLAGTGVPVLGGHCDEHLSVPGRPFADMARDAMSRPRVVGAPPSLGPAPQHLVHLVPDLAGGFTPPDPEPVDELDGYRVLEAFAGWLADYSAATPVLLILDDVHWADPVTIALLRHVTRGSWRARALIVATARDLHATPDPEVARSLTGLLEDRDTTTHVPLAGLPVSAIERLARTELGVPAGKEVDPVLLDGLLTASGGNPLFVLELLRQVEDGRLPDPDDLAAGLADVVRARVARLPEGLRDLLTQASVIGQRFDPAVLRRVAGLDDDGIDRHLAAAVTAQLVEPCPFDPPLHRFSHDLIRTGLYDLVPPMRRARLHRAVAAAVEQEKSADLRPHYEALAHHFARAGTEADIDAAVRYLVLAAHAAMERRAPAVAAQGFLAALRLAGHRLEPGDHCDLLFALGCAQRDAGQAEYRETFLAAARSARSLDDSPRLIAATVANTRGWWSSTAAVDTERLEMVMAALARLPARGTHEHAALLSARALETVRDPTYRSDAVEQSATAVRIVRGLDDARALGARLADHYAVTYASFTDPQGAAAIADELEDLARVEADEGLALMASVASAQAHSLLADLGRADEALARAEGLATRLNHLPRLWLTRTWRAMRLWLRGATTEAEETAVAAFEIGSVTGQPDAFAWFAGQLFTFRWQQGRLAELIDEIEEQVSTQAAGIPAWHAARILALASSGREAEAARLLDDRLRDGLGWLPHDMLWLHGIAYLTAAAELLEAGHHGALLQDALRPHAGRLIDNGTVQAGPVDHHLGVLSMLLGEPVAARRHLRAAADLCDRIEAPWWGAQARERLIRLDAIDARRHP